MLLNSKIFNYLHFESYAFDLSFWYTDHTIKCNYRITLFMENLFHIRKKNKNFDIDVAMELVTV